MARDDAAPGYLREQHIQGSRMLIKATCQYCGFVIIDSVPELIDKEWEHRQGCHKPRKAVASK